MRNKKIIPYLLLAIVLIYITIFIIRPLVDTIYKVFYKIDSLGQIIEFVGMMNLKEIINDPEFHQAIKNSLLYVIITVPLSKILGLLLAILSRKKSFLSPVYEALYAMPIAIANPTICMIFSLMYSPNIGLINNLIGEKIQWLRDPNLALISVSLVGIWISTGHAFVFFLPAIRSIPQSILDSSVIDVMNFIQKVKYVYYPFVSPVFFYLLVMDIPGGMMMMSISNILTAGGPDNSTMTIMLYIYRKISAVGNYTLANAATLVAIVMMLVVMIIIFRLEKRIVYYNE